MSKQDTLHTINEIYNAIKHLPVDSISNADLLKKLEAIKTKPKTIIEEYGVILGALIGIFSAGLTSLLNHLFQSDRDKKQKQKEIEFKKNDSIEKIDEQRTKYYMEASKYRTGLMITSSVATKLQITISCMAKKYSISEPEMGKFLMKQMEEQKLSFLDNSNKYSSDLKDYIAALSGYKIQKKGNTKINQHIEKMLGGLNFGVDETVLFKLETNEQIDSFMKSEKKRFKEYWKKEIRDEINSALDVILNNE